MGPQVTYLVLSFLLIVGSLILQLFFEILLFIVELFNFKIYQVILFLFWAQLSYFKLQCISLVCKKIHIFFILLIKSIFELFKLLLPLIVIFSDFLLNLESYFFFNIFIMCIFELLDFLFIGFKKNMISNLKILSNPESCSYFCQLIMKNADIIFESDDFPLIEIEIWAWHLDITVKTHNYYL